MNTTKIGGAGIFIACLALTVIAFAVWWAGPEVGHWAWSTFRHIWWAVVVIIAFFVVVILLARVDDDTAGVVFFIGGIILIAAVTLGFVYQGYASQKRLAATVEVTQLDKDQSQLPSFKQRQPFDVASAVSNRTLGDTQGNATGVIKSQPQQGKFSTSVIRRGMFKGYESVQEMQVAPFGATKNSDVHFCQFSENAGLRFGGFAPGNNLDRAIKARTSPSTDVAEEDAIFTCENDTPKIYAPLTRLEGLFGPNRVPAGVAVYDGKTGALTIEDHYDGDLPLYPSSVARDQRESTHANQGFFDWLFRRAGWDDTGKDQDDPNGDNKSEFSIASQDGKTSYYATPLTPRGDSSSIVGLGTVTADKQDGALNKYRIYTYPEGQSRQANSAVAASITGEILAGYKSSGLTVFEVVPAEDGTWVATVGKDQSILYRAQITRDGTVTLRDASGQVVGTNAAPAKTDGAKSSTGKAVSDMSEDELKQRVQEAVDELARRSQK